MIASVMNCSYGLVQASQPVDVKTLLPEQQKISAHIAALGLLYPSQVDGKLFLSPTFMSEMLSSGKQSSLGTSATGFIVVETSFRVYAYTTSPVQVCPPLLSAENCTLPSATGCKQAAFSPVRRHSLYMHHVWD